MYPLIMRPNTQHPKGPLYRQDGQLDVVEVFETIQGEGPYTGRPAVFVRLEGCNLKCPGCDTDYTSNRELYSPTMLLTMINDRFARRKEIDGDNTLIVLTGGEPLRQNIAPFVRDAKHDGWNIQLETNGTLFNEDLPVLGMDIVCSPKTPNVRDELKDHICCLKYVIEAGFVSEEDGLPISVMGLNVTPARPWPTFKGEVIVQPFDVGNARANINNLDAAVESCLKFGYTLGVQVHKIARLK